MKYFDVTMNDTHTMKIGETLCKRMNNSVCFFFFEDGATTNVTIEFTSSKEFHYNIYLLRE